MRFALCAINLFIGAVVFAIPNLTRGEVLFGVSVPEVFRESDTGRRAILMFRGSMASVVLGGLCILLTVPSQFLRSAEAAVPITILLAGILSFYSQNRRLAHAAVQYTHPREMELTTSPEKLPRFAWLAVGPFALLGGLALWFFLNWASLPARFPAHFYVAGNPSTWSERSVKGIYGPLFFGAELCLWALIMGVAGWFGSRRLHSRRVMIGCMIGVQYLIAALFGLIALEGLLGIPVWVVALSPIAILVPLLALAAKKMHAADGPGESTPNECWKGGIFYYNPNDAALVVEKRDGLGYSFNFANHWSWLLILGLGLVIASASFLVG